MGEMDREKKQKLIGNQADCIDWMRNLRLIAAAQLQVSCPCSLVSVGFAGPHI